MKKLILLALVVGGVVLAKKKSEQLKGGASKVAHDPRVQQALATAQEKAGPYAEAAKGKIEETLHASSPTPSAAPDPAPEAGATDDTP